MVLRVLSNNNCCQFLALPIFCLFNLIFPGWRNGQSLSTFCELLWDDQRDCSEMWSRYTKISRLFKGNWIGFRFMYSNCNLFLSYFIMRALSSLYNSTATTCHSINTRNDPSYVCTFERYICAVNVYVSGIVSGNIIINRTDCFSRRVLADRNAEDKRWLNFWSDQCKDFRAWICFCQVY